MHDVAAVKIEDFTQPMELFARPDEVNPTYLSNNNTTPAENHQENFDMPPQGTQIPLPHSFLTEVSVAL